MPESKRAPLDITSVLIAEGICRKIQCEFQQMVITEFPNHPAIKITPEVQIVKLDAKGQTVDSGQIINLSSKIDLGVTIPVALLGLEGGRTRPFLYDATSVKESCADERIGRVIQLIRTLPVSEYGFREAATHLTTTIKRPSASSTTHSRLQLTLIQRFVSIEARNKPPGEGWRKTRVESNNARTKKPPSL